MPKFPYQSIVQDIQKNITTGLLAPSTRMPSERELAKHYNVHRSTVARALLILVDMGLIERKIGSGTYVCSDKWGISLPEHQGWSSSANLNQEMHLPLDTPPLKSKAKQKPWIRLDNGDAPTSWLPQGRTPSLLWNELFNEAADGSSLGLHSLRVAVSDYLMRHYRLKVDPSEILITSGTQQSLFLITHTYLKAGDTVALESPSYFYSLPLFQRAGLRIEPIELDLGGLSIEKLSALASKKTIKMLFINPMFQNPTGIATSANRKKQILDFCSRRHIPIFEDDASGMLAFHKQTDITPIKCLDFHHQVLYAGSLSKYMGPSIRLGWLIGPAKLMKTLADIRYEMDAGLSVLPQIIVRDYLNHSIDDQIDFLRSKSIEKFSLATQYMNKHHPHLQPVSATGGFYLYYRFKDHQKNIFDQTLKEFENRHMMVANGAAFGDRLSSFRINMTHFN